MANVTLFKLNPNRRDRIDVQISNMQMGNDKWMTGDLNVQISDVQVCR
jgi:hypothetical protein